jgi:hypothetical protein
LGDFQSTPAKERPVPVSSIPVFIKKLINEKIISLIIVLILKIRPNWVKILFHSSLRLCSARTERIFYAGIYSGAKTGSGVNHAAVAATDT